MTTRLARTAFVAIAACTLTGLGAGASFADEADGTVPTPLTQADKTAATSAAASTKGLELARRVAKIADEQQGVQTAADEKAGVVPGTTTQVNVLSRDFVATGDGPVGTLGYVANSVKVGDETVSVWSVKEGNGWRAVNAASGDTEAQLAKAAGGGQLLQEPQINAWYVFRGSALFPLNDEARKAIGRGMSIDAYQHLVHGKYGNQLPGSSYDKSGMAGGFGEPASTQPSHDEGMPGGLTALGLAGGLGVAGLVGVRAARRRQTQR